jgi:hypothetical protein
LTGTASGGDLVTGFEEADALVAVAAVAVLDVAGQRPGEGVPVEVVGVVTTNSWMGKNWHSTGLR